MKDKRYYYETMDKSNNCTFGYMTESSNDEAVLRFAHDIEDGYRIYLVNTLTEEVLLNTLPGNVSN